MYRFVLSSALALTFAGSVAFAQQTVPPAPNRPGVHPMHPGFHHRGPGPQREAAMMSHRLNLSPEQASQIEPILSARDQKMHALMSDKSLNSDVRREQFRAIHEETQQQFAAVLSPEQLQEMRHMRHGRDGRGFHRPGQQPGGPTGA